MCGERVGYGRFVAEPNDWIPLPDAVAALLGRVVFYATWLDDILGEAVVLATPDADHLAESTPDWAASGDRLVRAVRSMPIPGDLTEKMADYLESLNGWRNLLVHGVWLWQDDHVMVMKRAHGKGERHVDYGTLSYDQIEKVVSDYQHIGGIADRLVTILRRRRPPYPERYRCPDDGTVYGATIVDDEIMQLCPACGRTASARPPTS